MRRLWCILTTAAIALAVAGDVSAQPVDETPGAVVFLNRNAGIYFPGFDSPAANRSRILSSTRNIPPFAGDDKDWKKILNQVRARFAPFDISIVDVEPDPSTRYVEAVVGGTPASAGFGSGVLGVAPFFCSPSTNTIVFVFSAAMQDDPDLIASTIEHEVGHAFGLDHQFLCKDPMTYLDGCGEKVFMNQAAACGEGTPRPCSCGASTQNSFASLIEAFGSRDGSLKPKPELALSVAPEPLGICTSAPGRAR